MSEKRSILLHNSHLFLKEEFTENTSNLRISAHAKAPFTKKEGFALFTKRWMKRSSGDQLGSKNGVKDLQQEGRVKISLRTEPRCNSKQSFEREAPYQSYTSAVHNKVVHKSVTPFKESFALLGLSIAGAELRLHNFLQNSVLHVPPKLRFASSCAPNIFFKNLNTKIRSGASREFVLVTLNLIVLTVFAVVQRSHYGKGELFPKSFTRTFFTIVCQSKVPKITSSCEKSSCQDLKKVKPGYLYRYFAFRFNDSVKYFVFFKKKSEQIKKDFSFLDRTRVHLYFPDEKSSKPVHEVLYATPLQSFLCNTLFCTCNVNVKEEFTLIENWDLTGLSLPVQRGDSSPYVRSEFLTETKQNLVQILLKDIQKSYNNKQQANKYFTVTKSQYFRPSYLSNNRHFFENDTIPAKRGTTFYKIGVPTLSHTNHFNVSGKRPMFTVPESVLKRCFYQYGFLLLWPSKKSITSFALNKLYGDSFASRSSIDNCLYKLLKPSFSLKVHDSFWFFIEECLVRKTSVSGYQFPGLNKTEVIPFFKKKAFKFSLNFSVLDKKIVSPLSSYLPQKESKKLYYDFQFRQRTNFLRRGVSESSYNFEKDNKKAFLTQLTMPFSTLCKSGCKSVGSEAPTLLHELRFCKELRSLPEHSSGKDLELLSDKTRLKKQSWYKSSALVPALLEFDNSWDEQELDLKNVKSNLNDFSVATIKMQYTQVDLNEIKNIKSLFSKLGRDYEEYLRKPKDSLPALIISPSLEDDREIEEEGIQIFNKRHFLQNTNTSTTPNSVQFDSLLVLPDTIHSKRLPVKRDEDTERTLYEHEKNESFTEKFTVDKTSLDNSSTRSSEMAEKGFTIDFGRSKSSTQKHENRVKNALRQAQEEIDNIAKKEEKATDKEKQTLSIPPLTRLEALYTIRHRERKVEGGKDLTSCTSQQPRSGNDFHRISINQNNLKHTFGSKAKLCMQPILPIFEGLALYSDNDNPNIDPSKRNSSKFSYTQWLFSQLRDENFCTDRKHSFWGEISLRPQKLSAQEQKQIFQQKKNPLLKTKSLESQFIDKSKVKTKESELVKLKVGDFGGSRNRIYFYKELSQNKACQSSAPKTKNTPLLSPVSHRMWQAQRLEPSTFRIFSKSKTLPVLPTISKNDWKTMMEWQLKKYFLDEDKRLSPLLSSKQSYVKAPHAKAELLQLQALSLNFPWELKQSLNNRSTSILKNKTLKIKKVNFYLPWIYCCKPTVNLSQSELSSASSKCNALGVKTEPFAEQGFLRILIPQNKAEGNLLRKDNFYWQLPTQQNIFTLSYIPTNHTFHLRKASLLSATKLQPKKNNKIAQRRFQTVETKPRRQSRVSAPKYQLANNLYLSKSNSAFKGAISTARSTEFIVFERATKFSWLFLYTFFLALLFKQLFQFIYKVGLKDFFISFLNSNFGRTITSEEWRYSIQNPPLTELYRPNTQLEELLGLKSNKAQLLEIIWFLRNKCRGRHCPRGIVLVGVPGVENISVVQAIAGEADVPIITQSLEKVALENEPQRQLEQLYRRAQKQAPCVLFIDQIDTIGARRDQLFLDTLTTGTEFMGYPTVEKVSKSKEITKGNKLNVALRLLTILDGITKSTGVITIATAQDLTKLDPALLRPKRFDRRIYLSLPNKNDRIQLLKKQTRSVGHSTKMPWEYLSLRTESMSVIDIKSAINYSLFRAVLKNSVHTVETLEYGIDCVKSLTEPSMTKNKSANPFKNES